MNLIISQIILLFLRIINHRTNLSHIYRYMKKAWLYFTLIVLVSIVACNKSGHNTHEEGVIHYEIKYVKNRTNVPTFVLPKIMVMKFNKNYAKTSIDAFGFSIGYIYDLRKDINYTLLQIMEHKFYYKSKHNEYPCGFEELNGMVLKSTNDTIVIEGLKCNKKIVSFPLANRDSIIILYTKDFGPSNPNRTIPYKEIDGILLQFNVIIDKLEMQFRAKTVKYQKMPYEDFKIPNDYIEIPREKMNQYIVELLDK